MPAFAKSSFDYWMDEQAALVNGAWFYARLAGCGFNNADGTSRQQALLALRPNEELLLIREADPQFPEALRVVTSAGAQVGYLDARLASETIRRAERGIVTRAFVSNITGSAATSRGLTLGVLKYCAAD